MNSEHTQMTSYAVAVQSVTCSRNGTRSCNNGCIQIACRHTWAWL